LKIEKKEHGIILAIILHLALLAIASRKYVFLGRFPKQDLMWNDLQLFRNWTWFSQTIIESGFKGLLSRDVDFRVNFGESIYTQSKSTSILFDPGAWVFAYTNNLNFSILTRLFIVSSICAFGIYLLMIKRNGVEIKSFSVAKFVIIFSTIDGFFLFHPQFSYEVGFLNSWFFFLVPIWLYIFTYGQHFSMKYRYTLCVYVSLISCAMTDIHVIIFVSTLALFALLGSSKSGIRNIFSTCGIFLIVFIIDRLPFIESMFSNNEASRSGTFYPEYLQNFVLWLFFTPFSYNFAGPVTLFVGLMIPTLLTLIIFNTEQKVRDKILKDCLIGAFLFLLLIGIGVLVHSLPEISKFMPSLWRYPLAVMPFILGSVVAKWAMVILTKRSLESLLIVTMTLLVPLQSLAITFFTRDHYQVSYNHKLRDYFVLELPRCIDKILLDYRIEKNQRSIMFAAPKYSEEYPYGRDDSLLYLIENPKAINGRTFDQWRYSSNYKYIEVFGYNAWPTVLSDGTSLMEKISVTESNILLSSEKLPDFDKGFKLIGFCNPPFKSSLFEAENHTLIRSTFVYLRDPLYDNSQNSFKYFSSSASFGLECDHSKGILHQDLETLPVAYRDSYVVSASNKIIPVENVDGMIGLPKSICSKETFKSILIEVYPNSTVVLVRNALEVTIFLTASLIGFIKLNTSLLPRLIRKIAEIRAVSKRRMRDLNPR
jgi:hypothetical protein